jgi:ubiquinone/menaquinone biosynthesis C-methylase UbiE
MGEWDTIYGGQPPWDTGEPQPEIVRLVKDKEILGENVLDVGGGLGDNAIFLSNKGFSVTSIDISPKAVGRAREKACLEEVRVNFIIGDALKLDEYFAAGHFDTVVDSGFFHNISDEERLIFAKQVWDVLRDGGRYFVICFSDKEIGFWGPRRITKKELKDTFSKFTINYIRETNFSNRLHKKGANAYIVSMAKCSKPLTA